MLECRACVLRAIRAVAGDASLSTSSLARPLALTPSLSTLPTRRRLATTATRKDETTGAQDALSGLHPVEHIPSASSKKGGPIEIANAKALQLELVRLKDPVKLAQHVDYTLRCEKPEKALNLCRLASKDRNVVVSWNHVIEWHIRRGRVDEALKIFNEMKKRGQFPDSYTYGRMFAAFPQHRGRDGRQEMKSEHVGKALTIYYGMSGATSRCKPTILHTNSVLRICSLARDMDALWSVASKIPESGPGAADHITYSILLGAIAHNATWWKDDVSRTDRSIGLQEAEQQKKQEIFKSVNEGKTIWQEVINKWRGGIITLDDQLVDIMAKVLLASPRMGDWDDVLNLVQQTTKVERLVAPLGSPDRNTEHVPRFDAEEDQESAEDADGWVQTDASEAFKPVTLDSNADRGKSHAWVQPGNGILNVLIRACTNMRIPKIAQAYWDKLTKEHGVTPDLSNFHAILGLLKMNRAAARAVNLVKEIHQSGAVETRNLTYRLAVETCQRDWKNQQIINITTDLVNDMEKHLPYPDVSVLERYLGLALRTEDGPKIVKALDRMDSFVHVLRSRITYGAEGDENLKAHEQIRHKQEAVRLFQHMVGIIDTLMSRGLVPREEFKKWHARRSQLNSFVGRAVNNVADQRRNLAFKRIRAETREEARQDETKRTYSERRAEAKQDYRDAKIAKRETAIKLFRTTRDPDHLGPIVPGFRRPGQLRLDHVPFPDAKKPQLNQDLSEQEQSRVTALRHWKPQPYKERLGGLSKWKLDDSEMDLATKKSVWEARAKEKAIREKKFGKLGESPNEDVVPEFETADSPGDLAMR